MKEKILLLSCLLIGLNLYSQNLKGKVTYKITNKISFNKDTIKDKKIKDIFSKLLSNSKDDNISFELFFNNKKSHFNYVDKMELDNSTINILLIDAQNRGSVFSDYDSKTTLTLFPSEEILIRDSFSNFNWRITQETKNIGGYICYKAVGEKNIYRKINNYHKKVNLTAWFSPELSAPVGPAGYGGLPGLILELTEEGYVKFYATKISLKNNKKMKSVPRKKILERIDYEKYTREVYLKNQ